MRFLFIFLLVTPSYADSMWDNFHPESVSSISCKVETVSIVTRSGTRDTSVWMASAFAKRDGMPNWAFTLAEYDATDGGFRKAMKECEEWTLEANKRIRAAKKEIDKEVRKK